MLQFELKNSDVEVHLEVLHCKTLVSQLLAAIWLKVDQLAFTFFT